MLRSPGRIAGFAKLMSIPIKRNSSTGPILHLKWQKEQHCLWLCMLTHRHHNMTNIKNFHTEMKLKPAPSRQLLSGLWGIHFKQEPHSGNGRTVLHPCKPPLHVWRLTNTRGGYNPVSTCNWRQEQTWERQHSWTCDVSVSLDLCPPSGRNIFTIQFHNEGFKINMNKQSTRCSFRLPLCLHKSEGAAVRQLVHMLLQSIITATHAHVNHTQQDLV